jgi:lipopolysaccharide transport system ATP-binding protein
MAVAGSKSTPSEVAMASGHSANLAAPSTADSRAPLERDVVVTVENASKRFLIYDRPQHRLWQGLFRGRRQFFRDFWAVRGVSLEIRRGETVGVIGRNGSGKSTLLQLVCGTLEPTSGTVAVGGRLAALLELGSGFNPEFTGRENVYLNGAILGLNRHQIDARFDQIAAFADIGPFIDQPVKTYSSGMTVRLAFSVIAHVDADLLVIDEALAVGDALFTQKCLRFLRRFQEHGSILFVSHDTGAVLNLCQRALWLDQGICLESGPAKTVVEAYMRANLEIARRIDAANEPSSDSRDEPRVPSLDPVPDAEESTVDGARPPEQPSSLFDPNAPSFGARGAIIQTVEIVSADGEVGAALRGGDSISVRVRFSALQDIDSAIIGYQFKDRLGQVIFGENTCRTTEASPVGMKAGESAVAQFSFVLPLLQTGKYTIDVAVAEGTQLLHVQHQWFFDAVVVHVLTDRPIAGVFAVAGTTVTLSKTRVADS